MSAKPKREPVGLTAKDLFEVYGPTARALSDHADKGDRLAKERLLARHAFYLDLIRALNRKRAACRRSEKKAAPRG